MRRTKEEAEQTRQQLLQAAMEVIRDKGYDALRLSDVAAKIGMTRGAVYWHFGSKSDLLIALFKDRVDPFFELIDQTLQQPISALQKLEKILTMFLEKLKADKDFIINHHLFFLDFRLKNDIKEIDNYFKFQIQQFFKQFAAIMQQGIDEGEIRPLSPELMSSMFAAVLAGFGNLYLKERFDNLYMDDVSLFVDVLFNGIKK